MRTIFLFIVSVLSLHCAIAANNDYYLSFFNPSDIATANTAGDVSGLTADEKEVVMWTNLARIAPQDFTVMLTKYITNHSEWSMDNPYLQTLFRELKTTRHLQALSVAPLLINNAYQHAVYSQNTLKRGHDNFNSRAQSAFAANYISYGENCVYFIKDPLQAVISLLIDDGVQDLGHRKIILSDNFNQIGVSMKNYINSPQKFVIQEFGTSEIQFVSNKPSQNTVNTPKPPQEEAAQDLKKMFINGKYVTVNVSKYYTWSEYQQYLKEAQKIKNATSYR